MRKLFLLLTIVLFSTSCYAAMDKVFSDWVFSEQTIILDNKEFYFKIGSEGNSVLIRSDDDYNILSLNSCKDWDIKRKICYNESFYESVGDPSNKAYIIFYYKKPKLNISRTIDDNIILVGEEATYSVTIYNRGEKDARDVYFLEDFPDNIVLKSVNGCSYNGNDVYYRGNIQQGGSKSCSYTITTTNPVDFTTSASVSYNNGFEDLINYSSALRLYSTNVLALNSTIENRTIQINEKTNFYINLTNEGIKPIDVEKLTIRIPEGLNVTYEGARKVSKGKYKWSDTLYSNSTKGIFFILEGLKTGGSEILINVDYEIDNEKYKITNYKENIVVEDKGMTLDSGISEGQRFDANTPISISLIGINKNNFTDLKNLNIQFNSTLFPSRTFELSTLGEQKKERLGSVTLTLPDVSSTKTYKIFANVTYETLYGNIGSAKFERNFVVEPVDKLVIIKSITPKKVEEFKEATVKVEIRNDKNVDVENVEVKEIFKNNLMQRGTTSTKITRLNKSDTVLAYEYVIISPDVINETSYNISTIATYSDDNKNEFSYSETEGFTVVPKKLKIETKKAVADTEIYEGEIIDVRYTIQNTDEESAKNIKMMFTENQYFDTINHYNYSLDMLNPDEILYIEKEQIRPKKAGEKLVISGSTIYYQDLQGSNFNTTSSSLTLKVKKGYIEGPTFMIEKTINKHVLNTSEEFSVKVNITNIGNEKGNILIIDGDRKWNKTIKAGGEEIFEYKTRIYEPGEIILPKVYGYYDYLGNRFRAVSNQIKVKVSSPEIQVKEPIVEKELPVVEEEPSQEVEEEKVGFIKWFWRSILNIFR